MTPEAILEKVLLNENPVLFLGAGFSLGGKLKDGNNIPTGNQFKIHLLEHYLHLKEDSEEYKALIGYNLDKVCEYIETIEGPKKLSDYILDYFRNCSSVDFQKRIINYNWQKIYTVNIDDLVEKIYFENGSDISLQNSKVKSTVHKYGAVEILKLHGCVNNPSEGVTFSTQQYIDSMIRDRDYRFTSLSLDMQSKPIIIVGATFDEINIDYYLKLYENAGYTSLRGNLFLINPNPPILNAKKIERLGGHVIKWTSEQFLDFLSSKFSKGTTKKSLIAKDLKEYGFIDVSEQKSKLIQEKKYTGHLYWGYTPKWEDVFYEWDFRNSELENDIVKFLDKFENAQHAILSFVGKFLSGKSLFLKRASLILTQNNYKVLYFDGRTFDSYFLKKIINEIDHSNFAIVVDDASYFYSAIKRFLKLAPNNVKIRIITASRPYFHYRLRYQFVGMNFIEKEVNPNLNLEYANKIAQKLDDKGYLGGLKKYPTNEERAARIVTHTDLVSFLYYNHFGKGFKERFISIIKKAKLNDESRDLLICLSIFMTLELPYVPFELVSMLFPNDLDKTLQSLNDLLKDKNSNKLELRADFISSYYITNVPNWKKIEVLKTLLIIISPLINGIDQSYWNEIQGALIKEKYLRLRLKLKTDEIRQMLYEIRSYYNNDSNFWIQLGLSEQLRNDFEKALNHFKTAESLNSSSYLVKNSIGRNYLKHARYIDHEESAIMTFEQGEKMLLNLIKNEEEYKARAYASHSYLSEAIQFYDRYKNLVTAEITNKMSKILDYMLDRDPEDPMTMEVNNKFVSFLKRHKKFQLFAYTLKDLKKLKPMFYDYYLDLDDLE